MIARRILDDVGDCLADTWYFLQTVLRDNDLKRNAECEQAVRGARIGFGAERVAATKSAALSELAEQCRDGRCVEAIDPIADAYFLGRITTYVVLLSLRIADF